MVKLVFYGLALSILIFLVVSTTLIMSSFSFSNGGQKVFIIDSCGVTIDSPGYYVVSSDLNFTGYVCLTVTVSGVVIDGDGRVIRGTGVVEGRVVKGDGGVIGISVYASNVSIMNIVLENLVTGIHVHNSSNVMINTSRFINVTFGVSLINSSKVFLVNNVFINSGLVLGDSYNNIVVNNTVNGKPLIYLENARNVEVKDAGQIVLIRSEGVTVKDVVLTKTSIGVLVVDSKLIKIGNVTVSQCEVAVYFGNVSFSILANSTLLGNNVGLNMLNSRGNIVTNNTFENNKVGLLLVNSSDNLVFFNDFINTRDYLSMGVSENTWSSLGEEDYLYIPTNTSHRSKLGNFWSKCNVVDENNDGINDKYCELDEYNIDYFPLASRRLNYKITKLHAPTPTETKETTPMPRTTTPRTIATAPVTPSRAVKAMDEVSKTIVPITVAVMGVLTLVSIVILTNKYRKTK